jgi:FdhD protein
MTPKVAPVNIVRWENGSLNHTSDLLASEEPMEIRLGYGEMENRLEKTIAVTMRTPGNDFDLALGFLFTEGIVHSNESVLSVKYCLDHGKEESKNNIVRVELRPEIIPDLNLSERNFYTTSSCGICGKASIDSIKTVCQFDVNTNHSEQLKISSKTIASLPEKLKTKQLIFEHTGGLHSSVLFHLNGNLSALYEDVGRHNALDKIIGWALQKDQLPLTNNILLVSGRTSFELIQKAYMAGIQIVVAIGAPSSLAVDFANEIGITLIGFTKKERFNVYSNPDRIV